MFSIFLKWNWPKLATKSQKQVRRFLGDHNIMGIVVKLLSSWNVPMVHRQADWKKQTLGGKLQAFISIQVKLYAFVMERAVGELYMKMASGHVQINKIQASNWSFALQMWNYISVSFDLFSNSNNQFFFLIHEIVLLQCLPSGGNVHANKSSCVVIIFNKRNIHYSFLNEWISARRTTLWLMDGYSICSCSRLYCCLFVVLPVSLCSRAVKPGETDLNPPIYTVQLPFFKTQLYSKCKIPSFDWE